MLGQHLPSIGGDAIFAGKVLLSIQAWGVNCLDLPVVIQSVSFQTQHPDKSIGGIINS